MAEEEDPGHLLSHFHRYTKITTIYRATIAEKIRIERKDLQHEQYKEGTPRQVRGVGLQYRQTHTPGWATHKQEDNYNCRGSPSKATGVSPTAGSPAYEILQSEDKSPELLTLKSGGAHFQEIQRAVEIETPFLHGTHRLSHTPGPRAEAVNLKGT